MICANQMFWIAGKNPWDSKDERLRAELRRMDDQPEWEKQS